MEWNTKKNANHDVFSAPLLSSSCVLCARSVTQMSKVASALLSGKYSSSARPDESTPAQGKVAP